MSVMIYTGDVLPCVEEWDVQWTTVVEQMDKIQTMLQGNTEGKHVFLN